MEFKQWEGFHKQGEWTKEIDVRGFIQSNYTPYEGDDSFLKGATEKTQKLWNNVTDLYAKRKRNIQILFCVSPEEKKLIRRKMIESKTKNMGAYLRKMAIDGYIVNTDTTPLKKQYEEMHKIGVNINQIAKKVNSTGDLYPEEKQELKEMVKELWRILRSSQLK